MEENQNAYGVWVPTYRCPRRCPWCLTRHRDRSSQFIGAEVFLRAAEPFGQVTASISGGEPLTSEAYALASAEVSHHYPTIVLTGLSLPITDSTFRSFVLHAKPENVRIHASLHTMSPSMRTLTFEDIARQKYFERVQELVNRGFAVEVNILYTHKNKNYVVLKAAERLAQIGVFMDALPYQRYDRISVKRRRMKKYTKYGKQKILSEKVETIEGDQVLRDRVYQIMDNGRYRECIEPRMKAAALAERINFKVSDEVSDAFAAMVSTRGLLCSAGVKMFYVDDFGRLRRCSNEDNPIIHGPLKGPEPCEVDHCVCVDQCRFIIDKYPPQAREPIDSSQPPATMDYAKDTVCHIDQRDVRMANLEAELNRIYNSHGWKVLALYYKVRDNIFPVNSKGRKVAKAVWNVFCKLSFETNKALNKGKH